MTHEEVLLQLKREYDIKRHRSLREQEARTAEVCARCPEMSTLLSERSELLMGGIRQMLGNMYRDGVPVGIDLQPQMNAILQKIREKLIHSGYPEDYLQPVYECEQCKDQGYLYNPERVMCECMKKELIRRDLERFGIAQDGPSFERFRLDIYDSSAVPASPRQLAEAARNVCERFANNFPSLDVPNLIITGTSGLGKTFLLQCIARRLMERLIPVEYISAYRFIEAARAAWFDNEEAAMDALLEAPLLMIDDLGTEPLFNNITITQLFHLINERDGNGKSTVITSNLKMSEMKERYTERITSRLQDPRKWKHLMLQGNDLRQRREKKAEETKQPS